MTSSWYFQVKVFLRKQPRMERIIRRQEKLRATMIVRKKAYNKSPDTIPLDTFETAAADSMVPQLPPPSICIAAPWTAEVSRPLLQIPEEPSESSQNESEFEEIRLAAFAAPPASNFLQVNKE